MFKLTNKTAVITGGGSGIGRAMSILFAARGATVHIIELNDEAAKATVDEIEAAGGKVFSHNCDISKQQQVIDTLNRISEMNVLINNAGIAHIGRADTTSEADFDRIYNVNIKGAYNCLFAAIPLLKANGGGVILNTASMLRM